LWCFALGCAVLCCIFLNSIEFSNLSMFLYFDVLYCNVLHCDVLCCVVFSSILLSSQIFRCFCIVMFCIIMFCTVTYCLVLHHIVMYCIELSCFVMFLIVLWYFFYRIVMCFLPMCSITLEYVCMYACMHAWFERDKNTLYSIHIKKKKVLSATLTEDHSITFMHIVIYTKHQHIHITTNKSECTQTQNEFYVWNDRRPAIPLVSYT
jgi:hypothetical protein